MNPINDHDPRLGDAIRRPLTPVAPPRARLTFRTPTLPVEPRNLAERRRHRYFARPVIVQTGRLDRERIVTNTRHAAIVLLHEWPDKACPKRKVAMQRCVEVMRGEKPPSTARKAFVSAARQAGLLIKE